MEPTAKPGAPHNSAVLLPADRPLLATDVGVCDIGPMTDRETAIEVIRKLPEDAPLREIVRELRFVAGVRGGLKVVRRGKRLTAAQVRKMISTWDVK